MKLLFYKHVFKKINILCIPSQEASENVSYPKKEVN